MVSGKRLLRMKGSATLGYSAAHNGLTLMFVIGLVLCASILLFSANVYSGEKEYAEGEVLVKFKKTASESDKAAFSSAHQLTKIREIKGAGIHHMKLPLGKDVEEAVKELKKDKSIEFAEPNYRGEGAVVPNDPGYGPYQWDMSRIGMEDAWLVTTGSSTIKVAVIDSGVDRNHLDLQPNLLPGICTIARCTNWQDSVLGHGTFVTGIIGAKGNNNLNIAGMNWNVGILPVKAANDQGVIYTADEVEGIYWAISNGAKVINASYAFNNYSESEYQAIRDAGKAGILFVAAAGNNGLAYARYPAALGFAGSNLALGNVISVAASDIYDQRPSYSNYGPGSVHLAAPGGSDSGRIYSTYPPNDTVFWYGTSFAAPHVTGTAALILARGLGLTYASIKDSILKRVRQLPAWTSLVSSG